MSNLPNYLQNKSYTSKFTIESPVVIKKAILLSWDEQRRRVYKKYSYTCQHCQATSRRVVAHHLSYKHQKGSLEEFGVLIALCEPCHVVFHKKHRYNKKKHKYIKKTKWHNQQMHY